MILWEKSDIFFKYISTEQLFLKLHETGHRGSTPSISQPMIFLEGALNIFAIIQPTVDPDVPWRDAIPGLPQMKGQGSQENRMKDSN